MVYSARPKLWLRLNTASATSESLLDPLEVSRAWISKACCRGALKFLRKTKQGVAGFVGIILPSVVLVLEADESWVKGRRWKRAAAAALTPFPAQER